MKKTLALLLTLALSMAALTGCGSKTDAPAADSTDSTTGTETPAALSGSVSTNGSTSMEKVIGILSEQFMADNSGVSVTYDPTGSGAGIEAASNGSADIGLSSRALKDEEIAGGLTGTTVALDGIAVIVNAGSKVEDLSVEQIAQIFTGEITNWSELGGNDEEILIISREAGSGTRSAFEEICGLLGEDEEGNEISLVDESKALIADSTNAVSTNVVSHTNAIGYISLGSYDSTQVHAINVGGVECTEENIVAGTYPIARPFLLVQGPATDDLARAFLDYILSADGQAVVSEQGYIPVA